MSQSSLNTPRFNPYQSFRFRVRWDGRSVAGISALGMLKRNTNAVEHPAHRDASTARDRSVRTQLGAVTLERGITLDPEFARWASTVGAADDSHGAEASQPDFRKDLTIDVYDEAGHRAMTYKLFRCWVSQCQVFADLDASVSTVAIQSIVLEHEGWERDDDITQPSGQTLTEPN